MTDDVESETVAIEPIFGHHFTIKEYQDNLASSADDASRTSSAKTSDSKFTEQLKKIRAGLGMEPRDRTRVEIIEHDIEWDEPKKLDMRKEYFLELVEKYRDELADE